MRKYLKTIIFTLAVLCVIPFAKAEKQEEEPKLLNCVEQMPQFPGGESALMKFASANITYPPNAKAKGIEGRVMIQFVVKKNGKIGEIKVARGVDPELDKEAVRVVRLFPAFTPGKMNGEAANCWYTLPINFKIPKKKNPDVFANPEQMPVFPGGESALMKFISANIIYPPNAKANGIEGRVIIQFLIKKDGKIGEIKVTRGVDLELDKEAVRIVRLLPAFIPGKMNGEPVDVWYTIPVNFKL